MLDMNERIVSEAVKAFTESVIKEIGKALRSRKTTKTRPIVLDGSKSKITFRIHLDE